MKCPTCVAEGKKSIVYDKFMTTTCMNFVNYFDEDGNAHSHDPNTHTKSYSCSIGHRWSESTHSKCPSCSFGTELESKEK